MTNDSPGDWQPLFETRDFYARELAASDVPRLQALFEANPEYFLAVNGRRPKPDEAQVEFEEFPPSHLSFTRRWFAGLYDRTNALVGVAVVIEDLGASNVWHIGLFLAATSLHGQGAATQIYVALEAWIRAAGARWLRLGVAEGNARAERFWFKHGFRQVCTRFGVDTGGRTNNIRVLVKPLDGAGLADYLAGVPRDRPDSQLP